MVKNLSNKSIGLFGLCKCGVVSTNFFATGGELIADTENIQKKKKKREK